MSFYGHVFLTCPNNGHDSGAFKTKGDVPFAEIDSTLYDTWSGSSLCYLSEMLILANPINSDIKSQTKE